MVSIESQLYALIFLILKIVFVPVFFLILLPVIFYLLKKIFYAQLTPKMVTLFVKVAGYDETNFKACDQLFAGLYGIKRPFYQVLFGLENRISLEIVGKKEGIFFYVTCPKSISSFVEKQIYGTYKVAEIEFMPVPSVFDRGTHTVVYELKQDMGPYTMINSFDEKQDPLKTIVSTLTKLDPNEAVIYQLVISPAPGNWVGTVRGIIANAAAKEGGGLDSAYKESIEKKISKQAFYSVIRLVSVSDDYNRAKINLDNTLSAFGQFNNPKTNSLVKKFFVLKKPTLWKFLLRQIDILDIHIPFVNVKIFLNCSLFNTEELSNLYHFANKELDATGIKRMAFKTTSAPGNIPNEGIVLGKNKFRDVETVIRFKDDDRMRHQYIIGGSGTGKSVFLFSEVLQDIYRGKGVCVIDPHGPDIQALLEKIPPHREKDVIYFNAADFQRPIGINLLQILAQKEENRDIQKNIIINSFIEMLRKMYDPNNQGILGPFFNKHVTNVMLTAMVDPTATLVDVVQLLQDDKAADKYLPKITDPQVIDYWKIERANMTEQTRSEAIGYLTSKFSRFTQDKFLRNIVAQSDSAINIPQIMQDQKILLVNLAKGELGEENAQFLGLLLVPKILDAAMARSEKLKSGEPFSEFFLYVDEFQNFATEKFSSILSEARKFKLGLTVANQFFGQLPEEIRKSVLANAGTLVFFRVGPEDAAVCKQAMDAFEEKDFQYISKGNAYVKLLIDGAPSKPFSLNVDLKLVNPFESNKEVATRIINFSRDTYGKDSKEIEKYINEKYRAQSSTASNNPQSPQAPVPGNTAQPQPNSPQVDLDDDFFAGL